MHRSKDAMFKPVLLAMLFCLTVLSVNAEESVPSSNKPTSIETAKSIKIVYEQTAPETESDKGTLILYRPFRFANLAGSPNVKVNETLIGELRNNRFIELSLQPGEYLITPIRDDWWNIECGNILVTVAAKSRTYVRMDSSSVISDVLIVNGTAVSASSNDKCWIDPVEKTEAELQLKKIKRATEKQRRPHGKD
ncbi:MAG: DUF2846 domain-containing protein [Arenimonas sp.]